MTKKKKSKKRATQINGNQTKSEVWDSLFDPNVDPNGSWTGVPAAPLTHPEQDVDDL